MPVLNEALHRYPERFSIISNLDPIQDLLTLITSLTSTDYLVDVISSAHAIAAADASRRAKRMIPHIKTALHYIEQALAGPSGVAFLPLYYAMLNLSKGYILLGPRHNDLSANRWHGAQYRGYQKDSQSLMTEEITLKRGGALPIFYETLTERPFSRDVTLRMADVYPYVVDIGGEYGLVHPGKPGLAGVRFESVATSNPTEHASVVRIYPHRSAQKLSKRDVPLLIGFRKHPSEDNTFLGPTVPRATTSFESLRPLFRPFLLYRSGNQYVTPLCRRRLLWPEELPILILFFHMSSVVRYKPEFFARLRDSRFWPVLGAAERHCLFKFLTLFWSFVHRRTLHMMHGTS